MNRERDYSRRRLLQLVGVSGISISLAGCGGLQGNGGDGVRTDEPTPTKGKTPEPTPTPTSTPDFNPNPSLNLTGEEIVRREDGAYIPVGESAVANCSIENPGRVENQTTAVELPNGDQMPYECGVSLNFSNPGTYTLGFKVSDGSGNSVQDIETVEAMVPPSIDQVNSLTDPSSGRETDVTYVVSGTDVNLSHDIQYPGGGEEEQRGGRITLGPEEFGEIVLTSKAENPVGIDQVEQILEAGIDQRRNLEKRKEAAELVKVSRSFGYQYNDVELMRDLVPDQVWKEAGIHPNLIYHVNMRIGLDGFTMPTNVRKYTEIGEDEGPEDLYPIGTNWERVDSYEGIEMYEEPQFEMMGIDRLDNWVILSDAPNNIDGINDAPNGVEYMIDVIEGRREIDSFREESQWFEEGMHQDVPVLAEGFHEDLATGQLEENGEYKVQFVESYDSPVTETHYNTDEGGLGNGDFNQIGRLGNIDVPLIVKSFADNLPGQRLSYGD